MRLASLALASLALLIGLAAAGDLRSQPRFPPLEGPVVDQAGLLDEGARQSLSRDLSALEADSGAQVVVVTVDSLQGLEIEDYGYQLGRAWGIGRERRDDGVLLIVAPVERKVRIEVGYGLEPVLTDALSARIIHNEILPEFRRGAFQSGILRGADAIERQLRMERADAEALAARAQAPRAGLPAGPIIVIALVFLCMFVAAWGAAASNSGRRRRRRGVAPILIWAASDLLSRSTGPTRSRGRWGGGFGGGGFSGGGGSFGGGGASGGW